MSFFTNAIDVLQTLVIALGGGLCVWGGINLLEGYGQDNPPMLMCGKVTHNKLIDSNLTIPNFISNKEQNKHSCLLCFFMFAIDFYAMLSYTVLVLVIQYKTGGGRIGTIY